MPPLSAKMNKIGDWALGNTLYVLVGVVALGTALRLYHVNYQSLWLDEPYSTIPTAPQNSLASIIESAKDDQPPVFFYLYPLCF